MEVRRESMTELWRNPARLLGLILCVLVGSGLAGCKEAKKFVADTQEGYQMVEEFARHLHGIRVSLSTNDFAKAREIGVKADQLLRTRILSWCVQLLIVEETEGVDAAKASVDRLKTSEGITTNELAALREIETYFQQKGDARTGDLLLYIGALIAEDKYGHGAGTVLYKAVDALRPAPTRAAGRTLPREGEAPDEPRIIRFGSQTNAAKK
jgi:hypothetical protein